MAYTKFKKIKKSGKNTLNTSLKYELGGPLTNKKTNFEKRFNKFKRTIPIIRDNGDYSTHSMAAEITDDGRFIAFPTVVQVNNQRQLIDLGEEAMKYALENNEYRQFNSLQDAINYSETYKQGTEMEKYNYDKTKGKFRKIKKAMGGVAIANPAEALAKDKQNYQQALAKGEQVESILNGINLVGMSVLEPMSNTKIDNNQLSGTQQSSNTTQQSNNTSQALQTNNVEDKSEEFIFNNMVNEGLPTSSNPTLKIKKTGGSIFDEFLLKTYNQIVAENGEVIEDKDGSLRKVHGREHKMNNDQLHRPDGTLDGEVVDVNNGDFVWSKYLNQEGITDNPKTSFAQQRQDLEESYLKPMKNMNNKFKRTQKNLDLPISKTTGKRYQLSIQKAQERHDEEVEQLKNEATQVKDIIDTSQMLKAEWGGEKFIFDDNRKKSIERMMNNIDFEPGNKFRVPEPKLNIKSKEEIGKPLFNKKLGLPGTEEYLRNLKKPIKDLAENKDIELGSDVNTNTNKRSFLDDQNTLGDSISILGSISNLLKPSLSRQVGNDFVRNNPYSSYGINAENLLQSGFDANKANLEEQKRDAAIVRNTANRNTALGTTSSNVRRAFELANEQKIDELTRKANLDFMNTNSAINKDIANVRLARDEKRMQQDIDETMYWRNLGQIRLNTESIERENQQAQIQQLAKNLNAAQLNRSMLNKLDENRDILSQYADSRAAADGLRKMGIVISPAIQSILDEYYKKEKQ